MTLIKTIAAAPGEDCQNIQMTSDEEASFISLQSSLQSAQSTATLISQAQSALDKSDLVATRCFKAGVPFPSEWQAYVASLRAIVSSGAGALPTQPDYPVGT